jgi:hypothetical protein
MTILEKFMAFAESLPSERRAEDEELLESVMDSDAIEFDLTPEELAEIDRRRAEPGDRNISGDKVLARMRKLAG